MLPTPKYGGKPDVQVKQFGTVAVVTGTMDGPQGGGRDRFLRVWLKDRGQWKAVAYHGTWIGLDRMKNASPLLQQPTGVPGFDPKNPTEQAIWKQHEAIEQAGMAGNRDAYKSLTTLDFVRVVSEGTLFTRDEWITRIGQRPTPTQQTNVRLRIYGDLAVLTYMNLDRGGRGPTNAPVQWMTRLFTQQPDGSWKLLLTQSTPARQSATQ